MKDKLINIVLTVISALGAIGTIFTIFEKGNLVLKYSSIGIFIIGVIGIIYVFGKNILSKLKDPLIEKCKMAGIIDIYGQFNEKDNNFMKRKIKDAEHIDLFFTTGKGFLNACQSELVTALKNGAKIRIIAGTNDSIFLKNVNDIEVQSKIRDKNRSIHDEIDDMKIFINDFKTRSLGEGSIELRHFSTEFRTSMILLESKNGKWGWVTLTTPPFKAVDSVEFLIQCNYKTDIYSQCKKHFDNTWNYIK
jgi:hypothetical protein